MNPHDLKQLQVQVTKAKAAEQSALDALNNQKNIYETQKNYRVQLEKKIKDATVEPRISEHALLRYIERVYGFDLQKIESEILSDANKAAIRCVINGKVPICNGFKAIVQNMTIVSIVEK